MFIFKCSAGLNPCRLLQCSSTQECHTDRMGIAECACPSEEECEGRVRPVCGFDGLTYDNACAAKRAACLAGVDIGRSVVNYVGTCGKRYIWICLLSYNSLRRFDIPGFFFSLSSLVKKFIIVAC